MLLVEVTKCGGRGEQVAVVEVMIVVKRGTKVEHVAFIFLKTQLADLYRAHQAHSIRAGMHARN
jgi:hypothetical protein